ncbi:hypothetical protein ACVWYK_004950 [Bradyrhizobium sp. USDA 4470]
MPSAITDTASGRAQISQKSEIRRRGYFTTRSSGRRGWSCVCLEGDSGSLAALRSISSHSALRSALSIPLSFILTSRMTIESNSADSRLLLSLRTLRHSSSVSSTDCNCWSECDTGVLSVNSSYETCLKRSPRPQSEPRIARRVRALEDDFNACSRGNCGSRQHRSAVDAASVATVNDKTFGRMRLIDSGDTAQIPHATLRSAWTTQFPQPFLGSQRNARLPLFRARISPIPSARHTPIPSRAR